MHNKRTFLWALLGLAAGAHAHGTKDHPALPQAVKKEQKDWGIAGEIKSARRTIEVRMLDTMRFVPERITVRRGETIRFVVKNTGQSLHEFVIGTKAENEAHAALMLKFPDMEHDEPYMAHVPAGQTGQIVWTFNRAGEFEFACLIAGHYQAGMRGVITVSPA
ncbi:MAG: cupredoxin family protein [Vitreoscilla sp.]|nr:cupredoxin family protein [Vitreoscilla sp.]